MALQHSERKLTVRQLYKDKDIFRFDLSIQRQNVWEDDEDRKTLLIDSLIQGFYVPNIMAMDNGDGFLWVIDGQQRLSTIFDYKDDVFKLTKEADDFNDTTIAGLNYSQLPKEAQEELDSATITVVEFKNLTEENQENLFFRLNNGMELSAVEKLRSIAGNNTMEFVNSIAKEKFFAESIPLSKRGRKRFEDEQLIFKIMMLLNNDCNPLELSSSEVNKYIMVIRESGFANIEETLRITTKYLSDAFPVKEKHLKKATVPIVFVMATKALKKEIAPEIFGGWLQEFFDKRVLSGSPYKKASGAGTDKKENVQTRLEEMEKDFNKYIKDAPAYKIKESTGRRGRKSKNEPIEQTEQKQNEDVSA